MTWPRPEGYKMRRFQTVRTEDKTGVSGVGIVAEGVQFSDGVCVLRWLTERTSTAIYADINDLIAIHGHGGTTTVQWLDE